MLFHRPFQFILFLLLSIVAVPAHAEWREASSDHFLVYGDISESQIRAYSERLERYDSALRLITGHKETEGSSHNRVTIYLLSGMSELRKLSGRADAAGFYIPSFEGSRAFMPANMTGSGLSAQSVLFHEYAHHILLSSSTEYYPRWLSEGMAEFFMVTRLNSDGSVTIGLPNDDRAYALTAFSRMRASELLASDVNKLSRYDQGQLYASGWLMVHYLLLSPERPGQLVRYIDQLTKGVAWETAARDVFGDLGKLDQDLERYRRTRGMKVFTIPAKELSAGKIDVRLMRPGEAAIMPYRIRSARGVDEKMAVALVQDARPVAAQHPNDAFVQRTMAEIEFDAKNNAEAMQAADRALALDPANVAAMTYKGRILAREAATSKKAEDWTAARSWLIKANHADPDFALPLILYYDSFGRAGQEPNKGAMTALMRAIQLVPQAMDVRVRVGRELVKENDLPLARQVLAPVLFNAHGSGDSPVAEIAKLIDDKAAPETIIAAMDKAKWNEVGD